MSLVGRLVNIFHNDVARPVQRDIIKPAQKVAPQVNIQHLAQALQQNVVQPVQHVIQPQQRPPNLPPPPQDPISHLLSIVGRNFIAQPAAEIASTVLNKQIKPTNPVTRFALGKQTVKPIQQDVKGVYQAVKSGHQNLPLVNAPISPKLAVPYAAAAAAIHAANDLPLVGAGEKLAQKGVEAALPAAKDLAANRTLLDEAGKIKIPGSGKQKPNKVPSPADKTPPPQGVNPKIKAPAGGQGSAPNADSYARTFGVSKQQAQKDLATLEQPPVAKPIPDNPVQLNPTERAQVIDNTPHQATTNQVDIKVPEGNVKGAIAQATGVSDERLARFQKADNIGRQLNPHDQKLLSERADPKLQIKPDNQKLFQKAASAYDDAYDYHLAANRAGGGTTLRFGNGKYAPLYLKATPEEMDKLEIPAEERYTAGAFTGFRDNARKYRSYTDAGKSGLQPLFKSPLEDAKVYARSSNLPIRNALLGEALRQAAPEHIADIGYGAEQNGKPFTQAPGGLPFNVSSKLKSSLQNFGEAYQPKTILGRIAFKTAEKTNNLTKKSLFIGTPFHYVNITKNFEGLAAVTGHELIAGKGLAQSLASAGTKDGYANIVDHFRQTGTLDQAMRMGIVLPERSRMDRFINGYALTLADAARKHGIDPNSQVGTDLGQMYNKVLGRMNDKVEGTNPTFQKLWSNASLAPHYMRTQLALVKDALTKRGTPVGLYSKGGVARGTVAGARAIEALTAITLSAIIIGRLPTKQEALNEAGLNRNNPVPNITLKSKNSKGESQVMNEPTDQLGLLFGLVTDPKHFSQSRYSPMASFLEKVATNTNWNGQPLAKPGDIVGRVKNAALNSVVPIGLQNFTNLQKNPSNPSVLQGIAQEFGGRLKTNPNDPKVVATNQYFAQRNNFLKGLNQNEQNLFNTLNPVKKDAYGQNIATPSSSLTKPSQYSLLQANPQFLAKYQAYEQSQKSHDPLWDLSSDQLNAYINLQKIKGALPGSSSQFGTTDKKYIQAVQNSPWYNQLATNRSNYYNSLASQGVKLGTATTTQPSAQVQSVLDKIGSSGINTSALLNANPAAADYLNQHAAELNQQRTQIGLPGLTSYSSSSSSGSNSSSGGRSTSIKIAKIKPPKTYKIKKISSPKLASSPKPKGVKITFGKPRAPKKPKTIKIA